MRQVTGFSTGGCQAGGLLAGALLVLLLAGCGGAGGGGDAPPQRAQALTASQPGELLAYVKTRLRTRATLREAQPGIGFGPVPALPPVLVSADGAGAPVLRSGTTLQEPGVDEDDLMKTDGRLLYTLDAGAAGGDAVPRLQAWRRLAGGGVEPAAALSFPADAPGWPVLHGLLLDESVRRIAVLGETITLSGGVDPCGALAGCAAPAVMPAMMLQTSRVDVRLVDAGDDGTLVSAATWSLSGRLVGARRIDDALVVVSSHAPRLPVDDLPPGTPAAEREAALAALTARDVLPTLRRGTAGDTPLVDETDCYLQTANASTGVEITTVSVFDLRDPGAAPASRCIVGGTEALYLSAASLVLATTRYDYRSVQRGDVVTAYPADIRTDLHKFVLGPGGPAYRGSGSVAGHLGWDDARKSYRLSEHQGMLRVLSFTGETGWASEADAARTEPSPATLTVLREAGAAQAPALEEVARLPNAQRPEPLGKPGEQVHAVRFLGERAYVVTFRRIDPLYVLDLADPADPRVAGVLEVPGFSEHLFPLGDGLLFGVGRQADEQGVAGGTQVALFDVRDPARPALIESRGFGTAGSTTALDGSAHGLNWLTVGGTVRLALPMLWWNPAGDMVHGLQRFEVDLDARRLAVRPMLAPPGDGEGAGPWHERSLQIEDQVYYFADGALAVAPW